MAIGDSRRVVQVKTLDVKSINEALRQLNESITILEGRKGKVQLKDGISSTTSTQSAFEGLSQLSNVSSFGIFYAGTNGSDTWIASGAKLIPTGEWIALNTRAAFLKLSNISGPQFYFNTGLTIGTSFIPTLMPAPGTSSIVWASYDSMTVGSPVVWDNTLHEESGYFSLGGGGTEVTLLTDGTHQIQLSLAIETGGAAGISRCTLALNGSRIRDSRIDTATPDSQNHHSIYHIDDYTAGDVIRASYDLGTLYTGENTGLNRLYITKLISS